MPYDKSYLTCSWGWLTDPEIKTLTLTGDFTRADQEAFFEALPRRRGYHIWGVESCEGEPLGAAGIKNINGSDGEFWCYIGERAWWGRGIGGSILELCEQKARCLGVEKLIMIAAASNQRSLKGFKKMGFALDNAVPGEGLLQLSKRIAA